MNLPVVAEQHEQERRSITAFRRVMEDGRFIVRDVRESDYGVDLLMEIKLQRMYASNFQVCIQIKDKLNSESIVIKDGKYSYPVNLIKINYLLNQPNSLFVIYLEDKDFFIWDWVYDIEKYAAENGIDIETATQETCNYPFSKILDNQAKETIHNQIEYIGKRVRQYSKAVVNTKDYSSLTDCLSAYNLDEFSLVSSITSKFDEAQACYKDNKLKESLIIYNDISRIVPSDIVYFQCAKISMELSNYKNALRNWYKALQITNSKHQAYFGIASAYQRLKDYNSAIENLKMGLKFKQPAEAYIELGKLFFITGDITNAINNLISSFKAEAMGKENYILANLLLADIYNSTFSLSKSRFFANRVLKSDPNNGKALAILGDYYRSLGQNDDAVECFQKSLDSAPDNFIALLGLSLIYLKTDIEKGLIFFNHWLKAYHHQRILSAKEGSILFLHIGWDSTDIIHLSVEKDGIYLQLDSETRIPIKTNQENDSIMLGLMKNLEKHYEMPFVGKVYTTEKDFTETIKQIENRITLIKEFTEKGQSMDLKNETKVFIQEQLDRVFIRVDINGYLITGFTGSKNNKKGFREFAKAYNKYKFFQFELACRENKQTLFYTISDNVEIQYYK